MMKKFISILICVFALTGFCGEDILYWMVDDTATVDGQNIKTFFENYGAVEGSAFAARVRVIGGNISEDTFLDIYLPGYGVDEGGGYWGVEFSEVGGYWGAGVPTGNQSPVEVYSKGSPEYSFTVELGNIDSDDNWTTVATSTSRSYSSLGIYMHETFGLKQGVKVWSPSTFTAQFPNLHPPFFV